MNDNDLDLFDKYQRRELSRDKQREFINRLKNENDFYKDFEYYQLGINGIQAHELQKQLQCIHLQLYPKRRIYNQTIIMWRLAAVILLFIISFSLFSRWQGDHTQSLFDQFFRTFPDIITTRTQHQSAFHQGMANYRDQNFDNAISILSLIPSDNSNYKMSRFYLAISLLADDRVPEAIEIFTELKPTVFNQQVTWYLALCYLKIGDIESSIEQLKQIKTEETMYKESQRLLERLK